MTLSQKPILKEKNKLLTRLSRLCKWGEVPFYSNKPSMSILSLKRATHHSKLACGAMLFYLEENCSFAQDLETQCFDAAYIKPVWKIGQKVSKIVIK